MSAQATSVHTVSVVGDPRTSPRSHTRPVDGTQHRQLRHTTPSRRSRGTALATQHNSDTRRKKQSATKPEVTAELLSNRDAVSTSSTFLWPAKRGGARSFSKSVGKVDSKLFPSETKTASVVSRLYLTLSLIQVVFKKCISISQLGHTCVKESRSTAIRRVSREVRKESRPAGRVRTFPGNDSTLLPSHQALGITRYKVITAS